MARGYHAKMYSGSAQLGNFLLGALRLSAQPHEEKRHGRYGIADGPAAREPRYERFKAIVIGGGQAGLSIGYHLARRGIDL